jgi:pimeloyl-ACP methyl ester carboxylesterase
MRTVGLTNSSAVPSGFAIPLVSPTVPGPPVLLVHGLAASAATTWREAGWLDLFADAGRTVIAPDLPGHGANALPPPPAEPDLVAFALDQLPDEPVHAIGFSLGANTILRAAVEAPDRFERLVLTGIGESVFRDDDAILAVADALEAGDDSDPSARYFLEHARRSGADPLDLARVIRRRRAPLTVEDLAGVTMPALVVIGERDFAGPGEPLAEALPDGRCKTLRGVDHFGTPKDFGCLDAALEFLDALPS